MASNDAYDAFLKKFGTFDEGMREGKNIIEDAREAFSPASLAPLSGEELRSPSRIVAWLGRLAPDRIMTFPIWAMGVAASHLFLLLVLLGVVISGGALLVFVAKILDFVIGVPIASPAAWAIAALASAGTFVTVYQSFISKLRQFPW